MGVMRMDKRVGLLVVGMALVGCGSPPPPEVPQEEYEYEFKYERTGEPLKVKGESFVYTTSHQVEIARRESFDAQGRKIGSDAIYGNETVAHQGYKWDVFQGDTRIDELSALHIARDQAFAEALEKRVEKVNEDHDNALKTYEDGIKSTAGTRTLGLTIGLVGMGAALATMIIGKVATKDGEPTSGAVIYGATGLIIVGGIGFGIMGAANSKRRAIAQKSYDMANAQVTAADFPKLANEAYIKEAAADYNAGLARKAAAASAPKKDDKKKPKGKK